MCTKFTEVTLAVHFRERNKKGDYVGGPMYYIKNGLSKKWQILAILYSAFGVLTVFGTGNATQVNTITTAIDTALNNFNIIPESASKTLNLVLGIVIMLLVCMVLLGGIMEYSRNSLKIQYNHTDRKNDVQQCHFPFETFRIFTAEKCF